MRVCVHADAHMENHRLPIHRYLLGKKVGANCSTEQIGEAMVDKAVHEGGLPHTEHRKYVFRVLPKSYVAHYSLAKTVPITSGSTVYMLGNSLLKTKLKTNISCVTSHILYVNI